MQTIDENTVTALAAQPITMVYQRKTYAVTQRAGNHPKAPYAWVDGHGLERLLFKSEKLYISHIRGMAPKPVYMVFTTTGRISASYILSQDGTHFVAIR